MKVFECNCVLPVLWGRVAAGRQVEVTLCPGPGPEGGGGVLCSRPDPRQARSRVCQARRAVGPRAVPSPDHSASRLTELCARFSWYLLETVSSNETIQTGEVTKDTPTKLCALREDRSFVEGLSFFLVKSGESVSTRTTPASCVILADEKGEHRETTQREGRLVYTCGVEQG